MRTSRHIAICTLAAAALLAGCAETPPIASSESQFDDPGMRDIARTEQAVTVQTRFIVSGVNDLRDDAGEQLANLEDLYVNVGAIFLDPADASSIAFSSRDPFALHFDIAAGETDIYGPEFQLPYAGDFFVSVQVEPAGTVVSDDKDEDGDSLVVHGEFFQDPTQLRTDEPSPLPWDPKDVHSLSSVDFTYRSDAVARIQLGEIHLREKGTYELVLTVNVADWLRDEVLPAVVDHHESLAADDEPQRFDDEFDFEGVFDEGGAGVESLVGDMGVNTRRF